MIPNPRSVDDEQEAIPRSPFPEGKKVVDGEALSRGDVGERLDGWCMAERVIVTYRHRIMVEVAGEDINVL